MVPPANNAAALNAMTEEGMDDAENQASAAEQDTLVGQVVSTLIDARLNTFVYTGLCRRNYTNPCPSGWTETGPPEPEAKEGEEEQPKDRTQLPIQCSVEAVDAENPNPACETYNITADTVFTPSDKEAFALKCKVQWPCAACRRDFSGCPENFENVDPNIDGLCKPKRTYVGPCVEAVDVRKTQDTVTKARWAAGCYTSWPCVKD